MIHRRWLLYAGVVLLLASLVTAYPTLGLSLEGARSYVLYIDNSAYGDYFPEEILRGFMIEYKGLGMEQRLPVRYVDAANTDMATIAKLARGAAYVVGPHDSTMLSQVLSEFKKRNIWRRVISAASTAYSLRGSYPGLLRVMPNDDTFMRTLAKFASRNCANVRYLDSDTNPVYSASLKERFNYYYRPEGKGATECVLSTEYNILRVLRQPAKGALYLLPPDAYSKLIEASHISCAVPLPMDPASLSESLPYTLGAETADVLKALEYGVYRINDQRLEVKAPDGHLIIFDEKGDRVPPVDETIWLWSNGRWLKVSGE
ncbi:hypothetical protein HPY42_06140 [Coprothermobacteraceae bacterium]|nr:hypothetical protein [Coprothermobacteraceae bacterium]